MVGLAPAAVGSPAALAGSPSAVGPVSTRLPRLARLSTGPRRPQAVERLVGEPVGVRVLGARHPGERRADRREPVGLDRQRLHVGVLDLPVAGHLLDDQLGVHPDLDLGLRRVLGGELEPGDQAAVLRDVVGRDADRLAALGDHLTGVGVLEHGAVRRRAGVAAGATVGLDDDADRGRSPRRSGLTDRTPRCAPGSGCTPRSASPRRSGALAMMPRSEAFRVSRQPPHSRRRSAAAPTPPFCARSFS